MHFLNFSSIRAAFATAAILLIPLTLQLTIGTGVDGEGFNWKLHDFVVMGILIFSTVFLIDIAIKRAGKHRVAAVIGLVLGFLWLWAELAVGVFTTWGS